MGMGRESLAPDGVAGGELVGASHRLKSQQFRIRMNSMSNYV